MRALVTGASGFLGSHVLAALEAHPGVRTVAACRTPARLPAWFRGEARAGDLLDPAYRSAVVEGIDVVCHCASGAAMWGHHRQERERFLEPSRDLADRARRAGVRRFILAGTVVMSRPPAAGTLLDDDAPTAKTGFWPHLDALVDLDAHLRALSGPEMGVALLRLGHFVGTGNTVGLVPALVPRLRTHLVPWLDRGRRRLPLVGGNDLGQAFALAATAPALGPYRSFNICGPELPTLREVVGFIAAEAGTPRPRVSVPHRLGYAAAAVMERLPPVLPGRSPFLTRSIVYLCEDWACAGSRAADELGYQPMEDWRAAVGRQLAEVAAAGYPWPRLARF